MKKCFHFRAFIIATLGLTASRLSAVAQFIITAQTPAANQRNVLRSTSVSATFNQSLAASAANKLKIFSNQRGGQRAGNSGVTSLTGSTLTFNPTYNFLPGEVVSTTLISGIQSNTGAGLSHPKVMQFTTAATGGNGTFFGGADVGVGSQPYIVVTADVDNDGDLDFITPNFNGSSIGSSVSVCLNNGSGVFGSKLDYPVGSQPRGVVMADFDADGDLDLATSNYSANTVSVRLNNGSGSFSGTTELPAGIRPQSIVAADLDGDGDLDLLSSNEIGGTVNFHANNGNATFSPRPDIPVGSFTFALTTGDVDNDGDIDLLAGDYNSQFVNVCYNNGTGSFSSPLNVSVSGSPRGVAVGDVDGDGDLDLLTADLGTNAVSVRLNNGIGGFSGSQNIPVGRVPGSITTADVDGDGDLDLLATNIDDNTVSLRLNNGAGVFTNGADVPVGAEPYRVAMADLDNDGDLDLLTANFRGSTVSVRLNDALPRVAIIGDSTVCSGGQTVLTATSAQPITAYRWTTGATTRSITVTTPGLYGVTATFASGRTATAQQRVQTQNPTVQIIGPTTLCGNLLTLTAAANTTSFRWNTGATTASINVSQPGTYMVTAFFGPTCTATSQTVVANAPAPVSIFTLGRDTLLCDGDQLVLTPRPVPRPGTAYRWSDGSTGPSLLVRQLGIYSLQLTNACTSQTATRHINAQTCINIPNIITANGDGKNDRFAVKGLTSGPWSLELYNRWGRKVYESTDYQNDWGTAAALGLYYYVLRRPATNTFFKGWVEVVP